ncbi:MAG: LysR family transcriptional regulator [Myxococcaceae bacterium]|nr:LysR family transcriptional regulator [Myxococcaceae bacterium]
MAFDDARVDLELLRTLLAIGDSATFAEAARKRRVTPPAVSQQMKALEGQLGVKLFERVGRRAVLTARGAALVEVLRATFSGLSTALEALVDDVAQVAGEVRLGGPGPFSNLWLRPRVAELLSRHPGLSLSIEYAVPSVLVQRLLRGELDLALVVQPVDEPQLASKVVHVEAFTAVASPKFLGRATRPRSADDFRQLPFLVFDRDFAMLGPWWRSFFGRHEALPTRIPCAVTSLFDLKALALDGLGIAVLPTYFVEAELKAKTLVSLDPPAAGARGAKNPISLCWRRSALETARFRAVREQLLEGAPDW